MSWSISTGFNTAPQNILALQVSKTFDLLLKLKSRLEQHRRASLESIDIQKGGEEEEEEEEETVVEKEDGAPVEVSPLVRASPLGRCSTASDCIRSTRAHHQWMTRVPQEWQEEVLHQYRSMRWWSSITHSLRRGLRDREEGFNIVDEVSPIEARGKVVLKGSSWLFCSMKDQSLAGGRREPKGARMRTQQIQRILKTMCARCASMVKQLKQTLWCTVILAIWPFIKYGPPLLLLKAGVP